MPLEYYAAGKWWPLDQRTQGMLGEDDYWSGYFAGKSGTIRLRWTPPVANRGRDA